MAFNFGAAALGASEVLEKAKDRNLKKKLVEKKFQDDIKLMLKRTELDDATYNTRLKQKKEEERKENIANLSLFYTPEQVKGIIEQNVEKVALSSAQAMKETGLEPKDYLEIVESNPLTAGLSEKDFETMDRVATNESKNNLDRNLTASPTEMKMFAGASELTDEQKAPSSSRVSLKPYRDTSKINTFEGTINDLIRQKFNLNPEDKDYSTRVKDIDSRIEMIQGNINRIAISKRTSNNKKEISKLNFQNVYKNLLTSNPYLSKSYTLGMGDEIRKITEGKASDLVQGFSMMSKRFNKIYLREGSYYADSPIAKSMGEKIELNALDYKRRYIADVKRKAASGNNNNGTTSEAGSINKVSGAKFFQDKKARVFNNRKEAINMAKQNPSDVPEVLSYETTMIINGEPKPAIKTIIYFPDGTTA